MVSDAQVTERLRARNAFRYLELTAEQVKTQYKTLVKRLHPDANGGSRANEDTLNAVIQAYDHLRSSGFC